MIVAHEMASSALRYLERTEGLILKESKQGLEARVGLKPERVRQLLQFQAPMTAEQVRNALARQVAEQRRKKWGRGGLPEHAWRAMYAYYCTGKSLSEVAALYGGTRQSIFDVFKTRGLKLRPRHPQLHEKIVYAGRAYTPGKSGYYRATEGDRKMLHHQMWEDAHGPIPEGFQVMFKNADHTDLRLDNMECHPIAAVTRYHQQRVREGGRAA